MKSAEIWSQKEYLTERKDNSGQKIDGHPSRNQWNHLWLSRPWQQKGETQSKERAEPDQRQQRLSTQKAQNGRKEGRTQLENERRRPLDSRAHQPYKTMFYSKARLKSFERKMRRATKKNSCYLWQD
jgi:hypothetical protein